MSLAVGLAASLLILFLLYSKMLFPWGWLLNLLHQLFLRISSFQQRVSQVALGVKNPPANAGDTRELGLIPGSGRSPGEWNGFPLQYSCLENFMDRSLEAIVHGVAKSQTWLSHWHWWYLHGQSEYWRMIRGIWGNKEKGKLQNYLEFRIVEFKITLNHCEPHVCSLISSVYRFEELICNLSF